MMARIHTEVIRIRLPKTVRAAIEIEAEKHHTDISKIIRKCVKYCFKNHEEFERIIVENGYNNA